jgi:hypothetical protein
MKPINIFTLYVTGFKRFSKHTKNILMKIIFFKSVECILIVKNNKNMVKI